MRFRNYFALVLLVSLKGTGAWSSPELDKGKKLYAQHCAECHGTSGEGVEDEFSKPLTGDLAYRKTKSIC
jgi:cytochrome c